MPRQFSMTWNRAQRRWFKKSGGKQVAVSCKVLAKTYPDLYQTETEEGSYRAANQWWADQTANQSRQIIGSIGDTFQTIKQRLLDEAAEIVARQPREKQEVFSDLEALQSVASRLKAREITPTAALTLLEDLARPKTASVAGASVGACVRQYLNTRKAEVGIKISDGRWDNLQRGVSHFAQFVREQTGINAINGARLASYHANLTEQIKAGKMSPAYARDTLQGVKQFIRWCYETDLLQDLPRNIDSKALLISVETKAVETFELAEVKTLLAKATDKTRLYMLLMLNCGMTQQDIADLTHKETNLKSGTITRKRSKTKKQANVPVVEYRLWAETIRLLKQLQDNRTERVIVTREGLPLVRRELVNGKYRVNDAVRQAWSKLNATKSPKYLRKTSASLLASNRDFNCVATLFLGHSPRGTAEKHYVKPAHEILNDAIEWLGKQYEIDTPAKPG